MMAQRLTSEPCGDKGSRPSCITEAAAVVTCELRRKKTTGAAKLTATDLLRKLSCEMDGYLVTLLSCGAWSEHLLSTGHLQ
jgi:hypothetical protein